MLRKLRGLAFLCSAIFLGLIVASAEQKVAKVGVTDFVKTTIYHSPDTPGYTCWTGSWLMPDGTLMVAFHQATGPLEGRPHTRKDILQKLSWPPQGKPEYANYDMAGTNMVVIYLASEDGGKTWRRVSADPGATPMNGWVDGQRALADGSILRTVWGQYLPFYDVPQTGYLQRSRDGGKTWGSPFVFDRSSGMTWPKRCRILRDGRLVIAGGMVSTLSPEDSRSDSGARIVPALWVSENQGASWSGAIPVWENSRVTPATEEIDSAELSNGDLLIMIRVDATHHRWQTLMKKDGNTWRAEPAQQLWIPHSGQPELLMTREGILLHLASDGIAWTADQGANWAYLEGQPRTGYYPSSVQLPDGRIFCVYHVGGDNYYGQVDQRIEAITFKLKVVR